MATEEPTHSDISPSNFDRVFACPPSVNLIRKHKLTSTSGPAAIEGKDAHAVAALYAAFMFGLGPQPDEKAYRKDMREGAEMWCNELATRACSCHTKHRLALVETSFSLAAIDPKMRGTTDGLVYCRSCYQLIVGDYKFGKGEKVDARNNKQMLGYGLGFSLENPALEIGKIKFLIVQPRTPIGSPADEWVTDGGELVDFAVELGQAVARTKEPSAYAFVAGKHCRYCPAAPVHCPEQQRLRNQVAAQAFAIEPRVDGGSDKEYGEKLSQVLKMLPALKAFIKNAESAGYDAAARGIAIPDFKLVDKYAGGERKFKDEKEAENALRRVSTSLADKCMTTPQLESVRGVEDILKEAGWTKADRDKLIKPLIKERVSSGTCLVSVADERPPVTLDPSKSFSSIPSNPTEDDLL